MVDDPLLAVAVVDGVVDDGGLEVQRQLEEPDAVGSDCAELGGGGDRPLGGAVGVDAPDRVLLQVADANCRGGHVEKGGGEVADVAFRYPRGAEIGVDVAGEHVLGLHGGQRLGVSGVGRAGLLGFGQLRPDVAREIRVGGLPGFRFRVVVDEVAELRDDPLLGLAVERGDVGQVDGAAVVERDEQPLLGAVHRGDGRRAADHVLLHDGRLRRLAGHLVVVFERHDQHGVRVLAEFHEVGHAADDRAVAGLAEGGLVDRAVGGDEEVVGAVQVPAGVVAVLLGPALVLRLEDAAGVVAEADQGREPPARHRAVGLQERAAVGDGDGLAAVHLVDRAVVADEEAAFGDVALGRRRREGNLLRDGSHGRGDTLGQPPDGGGELLGQVAPGDDAVAGVVEPVLAAPGAQHHLRVVEEVAVDRDPAPSMASGSVSSQSGSAWRAGSPAARLRRNTMSVTTLVPSRLKASDGRRIAPRKSARPARYSRMAAFCLSSVKWLVTRARTPPGFRASSDLAKKKSCSDSVWPR